jgi:hypothetical protein
MSSETISLSGVWSNSILINSQKLLTESIGPHYLELGDFKFNPDFEFQYTLKRSLKHVINILLEIKYMGCYMEGMDTVDTSMGEGDRATELEVVEREPEGVVLARHWTSDGAARHRQTRREWKELAKKSEEESKNMMKEV